MQKIDPLIQNVAMFSEKWHKCLPGKETYKAEGENSKKRQKSAEKTLFEPAMLQLIEQEEQKIVAAAKEKKDRSKVSDCKTWTPERQKGL